MDACRDSLCCSHVVRWAPSMGGGGDWGTEEGPLAGLPSLPHPHSHLAASGVESPTRLQTVCSLFAHTNRPIHALWPSALAALVLSFSSAFSMWQPGGIQVPALLSSLPQMESCSAALGRVLSLAPGTPGPLPGHLPRPPPFCAAQFCSLSAMFALRAENGSWDGPWLLAPPYQMQRKPWRCVPSWGLGASPSLCGALSWT